MPNSFFNVFYITIADYELLKISIPLVNRFTSIEFDHLDLMNGQKISITLRI
jgi:hypothetical protein